ncbi:MAG: PEP/pyruvate-binding domain-containing protein [Candidatus Thermoplasmatota archaeon]|nr:PEP/pyruvate-binding domain-containing protein [Candidatus Thermoplasmatota archaeon]|tara:strand:+ start:900 stop:3812 length:2913 start_codon:yes stop_codon:yes gene_type:complete
MDGSITDWNKFERLTPYRVREVLLVASQFDRYILEESGYLAEILQEEYSILNLSQAPRIIHSPDSDDAIDLLNSRRFDLIITMSKAGKLDANTFANMVKKIHENIPVVLLSQNTRELATLKTGEGIDRIFVWGGDSRILLSICKLIEDEKNVENDVRDGDVQVILLVEDSRRFYSAYLPLLYTQLVRQTSRLIGDEGNLHEKVLRLRARAKILLASDMDSAKEIIDKYSRNIIGIFTDGRFPNQSGDRDVAGLELVKYAQTGDRYLPILLQSKNIELKEDAEALGIPFLHKEDPLLYQRIEEFMLEEMSFGEFIFRTPDGMEICRASNLENLADLVDEVPIETIEFHAQRNEFSHWLRARTEFSLAASIRPMTLDDFDDSEGVRKYVSESIRTHISRASKQTIRDHYSGNEKSGFQRIGRGSLGGKGRGLAFFYTRMDELGLGDAFPEVDFVVPNSVVIGTGIFGDFIGRNDLSRFAFEDCTDEEVNEAFLGGSFGDGEIEEIRAMLEGTEWPVAVRSSSLLEDSSHQPFAGVYATYMIGNDHPELETRLKRLLQAIKLVYASIFHKSAKAYVTATANSIEDERMAVVIQEVVGREVNGRFYPDISGAARSRNHYPVDPLKMEDGLAAVCIGLGRQVSTGGKCLRFSPGQPKRIHQFHSTDSIIETSQSRFFAIPMVEDDGNVRESEEDNLLHLSLDSAEEDKRLALVGSTYLSSDDRIVDSIRRGEGARLVTFAPVLKHNKFPLAQILDHVLKTCEDFLASPVELEFAIEVDEVQNVKKFAILQVRPLMDESVDIDIKLDEVDRDGAVCISSKSLGNGVIEGIKDVVYVHPDRMDRMRTIELVPLIEEIDAKLRNEGRPYILIGPGRWGSSDPSLGIPVQWNQIMGAKTIIEAPMADIHVDPSQGTHFFQNIVTFNIGYLTIMKDDMVDWDWLDSIESESEEMGLRHIRLDSALKVVLDSRDSEAIVVR